MNNKSTDVVILGSSFRGIWLAAELVRLGWSVTWVQLHAPQTNVREGGFAFDDWPWQVGPHRPYSKLIQAVREFIETVIEPEAQDIAAQILTLEGPLELAGPATSLGLRRFFKKSFNSLEEYFLAIKGSQNPSDLKAAKKLRACAKKIFKRPLGERWVLEWLGSLRRARALTTAEWVLNWDGEMLDPADEFWLLKDSLEKVSERAMTWAEKNGVVVMRGAHVADLGVEGRLATGFEIRGQGFVETKRVIVACSYETLKGRLPKFAAQISSPVKPDSEKWCWVRCGFLLKANTKPEGLLEFSSFVMDPHMPLTDSNFGLLRWKLNEKGDNLTVWVRIPYGELKRRSFLMNLTELIQRNLSQLLPWFGPNILAVLPFEEYFHSPEAGHDDVAVVFGSENKFSQSQTRLKNVWLIGPGADRGLELLSRLGTEYRLLAVLSEIRKKELKKSDRTIHPARDGQGLDASK